MAEVNAKDLTTKTAPASTDSMLLFGTSTNEGAKITVDNLANNILERIATKTFPNQVGGSSAATILAQLATLNSKFAGKEYTIPTSETLTLDNAMLPHSYIVTTYASKVSALSIRIGTGYGMSDNFTTSRHKQVTLIDSTDVTMQPLSTGYGLVINNGSTTTITVWVINLTPQTY